MTNSTINESEIEKFTNLANEWWKYDGKFKPLHKFNPIRITYIRESIMNIFKIDNEDKPLEKVKILDIGCGGGLISEPMARLGAEVTGIDASKKNVDVAKLPAVPLASPTPGVHPTLSVAPAGAAKYINIPSFESYPTLELLFKPYVTP